VTDQETPRHVEIKDDSDHTVAEAEVTTAEGPEGTVRASVHAQSGHVKPGRRASLVDAVMDLPEVQTSDRMEAAVPYGDGESLNRLRERTEDSQARAAGATTLLDGNIPPAGKQTDEDQHPDLGGSAQPDDSGDDLA